MMMKQAYDVVPNSEANKKIFLHTENEDQTYVLKMSLFSKLSLDVLMNMVLIRNNACINLVRPLFKELMFFLGRINSNSNSFNVVHIHGLCSRLTHNHFYRHKNTLTVDNVAIRR